MDENQFNEITGWLEWIALWCFMTMLFSCSAHADCGTHDETGNDVFIVKVCADVNRFQEYQMPAEISGSINEYGSIGWQTKYCCLAEKHNDVFGSTIDPVYCHDAEIAGYIEAGICKEWV